MPRHRCPDHADPSPPSERNRRLLEAYAASQDPHQRRRLRDALVRANLPLVRTIAARLGPTPDLPFEDLVQVGSIGLLRGVERFDPGRRLRLSSFLVPCIQGAMRHELRDRQALVRIPRTLWELRQREGRLQEERRRRGQARLRERELVAILGCEPSQLREALALGQLGRVRSLDAPAGGPGGDGDEGTTLLERLPDPASLPAAAPEPVGDGGAQACPPRWRWLRRQLRRLDPLERELLRGRFEQNGTWVELGARLGMPPRQAQRRCLAVLQRLRQQGAAA
jgi:RNA polymerase sigma-B factor